MNDDNVHGVYANGKRVSKEPTLIGGTKNDSGKIQLSIIPYSALELEAKVFMFGAKKYERNNFKKGLEYSRLIDAALRHIHAFNEGEDLDPESNLSHLGHARCCLAMIVECTRLGTATDDRYKNNKKGND